MFGSRGRDVQIPSLWMCSGISDERGIVGPSEPGTAKLSVGRCQLALPFGVHPGLSCAATHMDVVSFIEKWRESAESERANMQPFVLDLCDVLGVPRPAPTTGDPSRDLYVFEKLIPLPVPGGKASPLRADVYKHGCFVLEAKQSPACTGGKTGMAQRKQSMNVLACAHDQAIDYALALDVPPPFIVLCDIGYCFELYANFEGKRSWRPFPDPHRKTIFLTELGSHLDTLRAVFTNPLSLADRCADNPRPMIRSSNHVGVSPFEPGSAVVPERFIGRDAERAAVKVRIGGISAQHISIVGQYRSGKSSLLKYIKERIIEFCPKEQNALVVSLDLQASKYHTPNGVIEGIRQGIEQRTGIAPWRREENTDGFAVDDGLADLRARGIRLIVLLDELERIGARLDRFQDWGEDFRAKANAGYFALVIASRHTLKQVYLNCGLTSPFGNIFSLVTLGAMPRAEWIFLVRQGFERAKADIASADIELIDELAGGLPFHVQMAAMLLWQHRNHDTVRREFQFQMWERFMELWGGLSAMEQRALRHHSGTSREIDVSGEVQQNLERFGLIRPSGGLFSTAFAAFVREQR